MIVYKYIIDHFWIFEVFDLGKLFSGGENGLYLNGKHNFLDVYSLILAFNHVRKRFCKAKMWTTRNPLTGTCSKHTNQAKSYKLKIILDSNQIYQTQKVVHWSSLFSDKLHVTLKVVQCNPQQKDEKNQTHYLSDPSTAHVPCPGHWRTS